MRGRNDSAAEHTPASLRAVTERISTILAGVNQTAEELEKRGLSLVTVRYQKALLRSLDDLMRWAGAVQKAMTDRLASSGTLDATGYQGKSKKPKA